MSFILIAVITTILYFIISFVFNLLFTTLSLIIPFFVVIAKLVGFLLGAIAFVLAYLIVSILIGQNAISKIMNIMMIAIVMSVGFKILGWILSPLTGIFNFLFPIACILMIKKILD